MKTPLLWLVSVVLMVVPCSGSDAQATLVAQVSVRLDGEVLVDGARSDLRRLHLLFASRREAAGEVWLYRASSMQAQRVAIEVIELARTYSLSVLPLKIDPLKIFPAAERRQSR